MPVVEVVWWNVQRLFAPATSRISAELDTTPSDGWTEEVYHRKLDNVAATLRYALAGREAGVVALGEIENSRVLSDLLKRLGRDELVEATSDDAHLEAHDVTVLYSRARFEQIAPARSFNIHNRFRTRDLYEVTLRARDGSDLMILANHWPSRLISDSEALRIALADRCRRHVESWVRFDWTEMLDRSEYRLPERAQLEQRWDRPGLVLGDFNDEPFSASVARVLGASRRRDMIERAPEFPRTRDLAAIKRYLSMRPRLYNPTWSLLSASEGPAGTAVWDSDWFTLDQIMMTRGMLSDGPIHYVEGTLRAIAAELVPADVDVRPVSARGIPRAFALDRLNGVSDHLPIMCTIEVP